MKMKGKEIFFVVEMVGFVCFFCCWLFVQADFVVVRCKKALPRQEKSCLPC
jgi:hypothetical protein